MHNSLNNMALAALLVVNVTLLYLIECKGVIVERVMAGHFMTSLDMAGLQIMIMHLNDDRRRALGNVICEFFFKQMKKTDVV